MDKKKNIAKSILITLAFPLVMWGIMEVLVRAKTGHAMIVSMLDIKTIVRNAGISAMIAYALAFNLLSGRFDLSLGAQRLAGTIIGGLVALHFGFSGIGLLICSLLFGLLFGFLTGLMFVTFRVPPMVLGIGMGLIWEVVPYIVSDGKGLNVFGNQDVAILIETPFIIGITVVVGAVVTFIMSRTKFGYELKAIQGSQQIAQNSGINIFKNTVLCYTFAGGLVCMAGAIATAYSTNLSATLGLTSSAVVAANMFPMIVGQYIGRWSNSGVGIIVASITIRIFSYGLTLMEFSEANSSMFNMLFFVGFLIFLANEDIYRKRKAEKARVAEALSYKTDNGIA